MPITSLVTFGTFHVPLPSETCSVHCSRFLLPEEILNHRTAPLLGVNSGSMSPVPGYPHCPAIPAPSCTGKRFPEQGLFWSDPAGNGIIQPSPPGLNLKDSLFCFLQTQSSVKREPSVRTLGRAGTINSDPRARCWAEQFAELHSH